MAAAAVVVVVVVVDFTAVRGDMVFFPTEIRAFIQREFNPISNSTPSCLATCPHDAFQPLRSVKSLDDEEYAFFFVIAICGGQLKMSFFPYP